MKKALALSLSIMLLSTSAFAQSLDTNNVEKLERRSRKLAKQAEMKTVCVVALAGAGSGAVVSEDGHIVTNAHVAALSPYAVMIFADGRKVLAKRLGIDYKYDLAYFKLEGSTQKWDHFEIAESSPKPGQWVAGVGHPGGPKANSKPSFSLGIITAPGSGPRMVNGVLDYSDAIVSDVPLFPGNSGGPMVSLKDCELLGINGAVNLGGGASFTIPIERVKARIKRLKNGVTLLPGNLEISKEKFPFLKPIFEGYEQNVLRIMRQRLSPNVQFGARSTNAKVDFLESDKLAMQARRTKRNQQLVAANARAMSAAKSVTLRVHDQDGKFLTYATRIDANHVVAMTDKLASRSVFYLQTASGAEAGRAKIVKSHKGTGLSALRVSVSGDAPEFAKYSTSKQIGRMLFTNAPRLGNAPKSIGAIAGFISSPDRPISKAREAARAASGDTTPKPVKQFIKLIVQVARTLKIRELEVLVKQIENASKLRQNYMRGSRPRGFKRAFTHDLPLAPSEVGTALVDRDGNLVGVNVANAHYGSSYAVSIATIRKVFGGKVTRNRRAKLY